MKNMSISSLLSYAESNQARILNAIHHHNENIKMHASGEPQINTVGDLISMNHINLLCIENMGKKSINELCNALRRAAAESGCLSPEQLKSSDKIEYLWSWLEQVFKEDPAISIQEQINAIQQELNICKYDYLRLAKDFHGLYERYDEFVQEQGLKAALDPIAISALQTLIIQKHLTCTEAATAAYNYAEAMQAESQKRLGGDK